MNKNIYATAPTRDGRMQRTKAKVSVNIQHITETFLRDRKTSRPLIQVLKQCSNIKTEWEICFVPVAMHQISSLFGDFVACSNLNKCVSNKCNVGRYCVTCNALL